MQRDSAASICVMSEDLLRRLRMGILGKWDDPYPNWDWRNQYMERILESVVKAPWIRRSDGVLFKKLDGYSGNCRFIEGPIITLGGKRYGFDLGTASEFVSMRNYLAVVTAVFGVRLYREEILEAHLLPGLLPWLLDKRLRLPLALSGSHYTHKWCSLRDVVVFLRPHWVRCQVCGRRLMPLEPREKYLCGRNECWEFYVRSNRSRKAYERKQKKWLLEGRRKLRAIRSHLRDPTSESLQQLRDMQK